MSNNYNAPKLVEQGKAVAITRGGDIGSNDPDRVTALPSSASSGFGL